MLDIAIVAVGPADCKTLWVERCPYCGRHHWHAVRGSPYDDIREANCRQRDLPKRLRGRPLYYRLHRVRAMPATAAEVIPFPAVRRK